MTGPETSGAVWPRRVGIFGGSFDPVHQAHVALGRVAVETLRLHELRWVPAGQPWQKARRLADGAHREAMLRRALDEAFGNASGAGGAVACHRVETIELERAGPSYTEDTLNAFAARDPGAEWFLIIGQDQYANLHTWRGWERIVGLATLAVAARAGQPVAPGAELAAVPHRMVTLPLPAMAVSSTAVRDHLNRGGQAQALVPAMLAPTVASYIDQHHLYGHAAPA